MNFCRGANLFALLKSETMPKNLKPHVDHLLNIYERQPHKAQNNDSLGRLSTLGSEEYSLLVEKLNKTPGNDTVWLSAEAWCKRGDSRYYGSVSSQCEQMKKMIIEGLTYAVASENPKNSVIAFVEPLGTSRLCFAQIEHIFSHRRVSPRGESTIETFLFVREYPSLDACDADCFQRVNCLELQSHVCLESPSTLRLIRPAQVVAHCAWVIYKSREFHPSITRNTIALVNLDRS